MIDQPINTADLKDSVKLMVGGDFLTGKNIDYEIYKEVKWWFDTKVNEGKTKGFYIWRAGEKQDGDFSDGVYYFEARTGNKKRDSRYLSDGSDNPYGKLTVSSQESNDPPKIKIINPENKQIYFLNEQLDFSFIIEDEDDQAFTYDINLGESSEKRTGTSQGTIQFQYAYPTTGQKVIYARVWDARGNTTDNFTSILIIDSTETKYVFSYIDEPVRGTFFSTRNVNFDATSSYAIEEVMTSGRTISCLAGLCPPTTKGCPPPDTNYPSCQIAVGNAPSDISSANYVPLKFEWKFEGPQSFEETCKSDVGEVSDDKTCDELFKKTFAIPGLYLTTLNISINPSSSITTIFNTHFEDNKPACFVLDDNYKYPGFSNGNYWKYPDTSLLDSSNNCFEVDGVDGFTWEPRQECCSVGFSCDVSTDTCVSSEKDDCWDFTSQSDCDADNGHSGIARDNLIGIADCRISDQPFGDFCVEKIPCRCSWDSSSNSCNPNATRIYEKRDASGNIIGKWHLKYDSDTTTVNEIKAECNSAGEEPLSGECIVGNIETVTECGPGVTHKVLKVDITYTGDIDDNLIEGLNCQDQVIQIPCSRVVKLGFFGMYQLIALLIILFFYYLLIQKNSSRKK